MITRFAPSPTGYLHLGHALAARIAYDTAREQQGVMLLRYEDIDVSRVRPEYYDAIEEDLTWLGIHWYGKPLRQLDRLDVYESALQRLKDADVVYPCFCTRKEIASMGHAPQQGDENEGVIYPGFCRDLGPVEREQRMRERPSYAWRLDAAKAAQLVGEVLFVDRKFGEIMVDAALLGDVVLARKDIGVAYHLAVVVDDAAQSITHVTRGEDLLSSTHVHCLLQNLLGLSRPLYHHHALVCDDQGKRLAKRHDALSLRHMRAQGISADEILAMLKQ